MDGERVKNGFEWRRTEKILRSIEQEHNLTPVACSWESARSLPTRGQSERYRREVAAAEADPNLPTPELPVSTKLQDLIDEVIPYAPTMTDYVARLQSKGVAFQGAQLQGCSFPKLQKRGVSYERERDLSALNAVARGEKLELDIALDFSTEVEPEEELVDLEFIRVPAVVVKEHSKRPSQSQSYGLSM